MSDGKNVLTLMHPVNPRDAEVRPAGVGDINLCHVIFKRYAVHQNLQLAGRKFHNSEHTAGSVKICCGSASEVKQEMCRLLFLWHIYITLTKSTAQCILSHLALCDDVTFVSPSPQGGCWGLEPPAGNPRHPSFPLPFVPWWGNREFGVVGVA